MPTVCKPQLQNRLQQSCHPQLIARCVPMVEIWSQISVFTFLRSYSPPLRQPIGQHAWYGGAPRANTAAHCTVHSTVLTCADRHALATAPPLRPGSLAAAADAPLPTGMAHCLQTVLPRETCPPETGNALSLSPAHAAARNNARCTLSRRGSWRGSLTTCHRDGVYRHRQESANDHGQARCLASVRTGAVAYKGSVM